MYRPSLKNNSTLVMLTLLAVILFLFTHYSHREIPADWQQEKIAAAVLMEQAMQCLKQEVLALGYSIDQINDPNETGLIGINVSSITTSRGNVSERLMTLNPNFAAIFIDLLKKLNLTAGDYVAVGVTGANPGANLALFAALETLKINPVIITSVGAATYGANRENFTWLDFERILYENHLISFYSEYATLGGTNDLGRGLPPEGRESIIEAVELNNRHLLNSENLEESVQLRLNAYQESLPENMEYRAFINVGAGVGNVGSLVNARIISTGINRRLGERNFREPGVMMFFARNNIPVIHIYNINKLVSEYQLPRNPFPMPNPGTGSLFSARINNIYIASICLVILVVAIIGVIVFDRKSRSFSSNLVDPDEEL